MENTTPREQWITVAYPSTGATGVTYRREYPTLAQAERFATAKRRYLTRAYGPRFAAKVVIEAPEAR